MATYYHGGSEIQADHGLQTLYLMNPNYVAYSDTPQQPAANMILLNSAGHALNPTNIPQAPPQQVQHFVGIPLSASASTVGSSNSDDSSRQSMHGQLDHTPSNIHASGGVPYFHYNLWGSVNQPSTTNLTGNYPHIPPMSTTAANSGVATDVSSQLGFRRPTPVVSSATQQGLSLSLSPQKPPYRASASGDREIQAHSQVRTTVSLTSGDNMRICGGSFSSASALSTGISGLQNVSLDCKYLKAAQELLDEVVYVGKGIKTENIKEMRKMNKEETTGVIMDGSSAGDSSTKRGAELTTAQRQELQMKKANLVNMLDEVEQRYRQYHQQVQIVVSAFEHVAGFGAAKSYTALSLQRISKQFRCLKDAVSAQIKATSKSLGEDQECVNRGKAEGSSRLKFVDDQLRQQRALQQLGMIQHNAWRPQRGLPERAVSVLRAWLFEHFLHPYPKDSDKHMLAKQTGLTRSQVSNWFINARVRLWKPMVEEMYQEEIKDQEQNGPIDNITKHEENKNSGLKPTAQIGIEQLKGLGSKKERCSNQKPSPSEISQFTAGSLQPQAAGFSLIGSPKKPRSSNDMQNSPSSILSMDMDHMKPGAQTSREINTKLESNQPHSTNGYSLITGLPTSNESGFGAYPNIVEIGRFNPQQLAPRFHGNVVSLTLGLPHCENLSQQSYLSGEADFCGINTSQPASHSTTGYENIGIQNRKRFAAQLLPDFVT